VKENNFKNMKKRPKLELEKILDVLYNIKYDIFYFKEYGKDLISSFVQQQQTDKLYNDEEMLEIIHKFGFDYTYNYKGEKTIYEWIPEWFEEYKRLEQFKNK
jgi:hypothetical protein